MEFNVLAEIAWWKTTLAIVFIIVCILLVFIVLLQKGRGGPLFKRWPGHPRLPPTRFLVAMPLDRLRLLRVRGAGSLRTELSRSRRQVADLDRRRQPGRLGPRRFGIVLPGK